MRDVRHDIHIMAEEANVVNAVIANPRSSRGSTTSEKPSQTILSQRGTSSIMEHRGESA